MKMEKTLIKIKELSPPIISLIEKIQLLESTSYSTQEKIDCIRKTNNIVNEIHDVFEKAFASIAEDDHLKILKERVERACSQFEWIANVGTSPFESIFQKHSENAKTLLSSILKILGTKGCGILIIETYLNLCIKIVDQMINVENTNQANDKLNFTVLLEGIFTTTNMLKKYWHIIFLPDQKSAIALCLSQICKALPVLLNMIEVNNIEVKKFALKMLKQCINKILLEVYCDGHLEVKSCGQEFIILINYCLDKLSSLTKDTLDSFNFIKETEKTILLVKPMIDEILCYAMSIAQVTESETDYNSIIGSSLKVIKDLKDLSNSHTEENICEIKLNAQSVGESLCCMERQVNTAVLRLVLEVFAGINSPLKKLVNKCRTNIHKDNKTIDDLSVLISDFDAELDRIMQIGLFTISCSSDLIRILGIRSCLATLETLATELIPSLTALYVECSLSNKSKFQHLINFWFDEMTGLKILIDSVLDPAGFCEIVHNQIKNLMEDLKNDLNLIRAKSVFIRIIRYSKKLIKTLRTSLQDECEMFKETARHIENFQRAVQECEAAYKLLEKEMDGAVDKVVKRGDFLLQELNKLLICLFSLVNSKNLESKSLGSIASFSLEMIPEKNYYYLDYTEVTCENPTDKEMLTPYINKGIIKSKKRSIFYTTPSKAEKELEESFEATLHQVKLWHNTPVSKKRSRCCKPLNSNLELGNTIDLEFTSVLDSLLELKQKLSVESDNASTIDAKNFKEKKDAICETECESSSNLKSSGCCVNMSLKESKDDALNLKEAKTSDECNEKTSLGSHLRNNFLQSLNDLSTNASLLLCNDTNYNSDIDSSERLKDLQFVDEKIKFLRKQVSCMLP